MKCLSGIIVIFDKEVFKFADQMKRIIVALAFLALLLPAPGAAARDSLRVRFLGTGAADWKGPSADGEYRRTTSALLDGSLLIDFNSCNADMLPEGCSPQVAFYTHSHGDHYNAKSALEQGIRKVYVSETWSGRCRADFAKASEATGLPVPEVIGLKIGQRVEENGLVLTALPGNHATGHLDEQCLIYLVEKGGVRLLYATDTGGIMAVAARLAGIDAHIPGGKPITALVMEATMGADFDEDFRIYTHSSLGTVLRTAHVLQETGRLEGDGPVYLTHLARTLHPSQKELDSTLPPLLRAAYDGEEVIFSK